MSESLLLIANLLCRAPLNGNQAKAIAPQTCTQSATAPANSNFWQTTSDSLNRSPRSGSQLYTQRVHALLQGQLHTSLKEGASVRLWSGAAPQPTHQQWQQLLSQEAYLAAKYQDISPIGILVGDSLSLWFPNDLLPDNKLWLNQGVSGENTSQILTRLANLNAIQPETIYLMAGVNDLKQGVSEATLLNNIRIMIRYLRCYHPDTVIVLQSLLPTDHPYLQADRATRLNRQLQRIATEERANYLNLYPLFADTRGKLRPGLSTDGLHLSRAGYELWRGALQNFEDCLTRY